MSPISNRLERLAELHQRDVLAIQEWWAERASIREHDGGYSRAEAERLALEDIERELGERP